MASRQATRGALAVLMCLAAMLTVPQAGQCQRAAVTVNPESKTIELKGMNTDELKAAIGDAAQKGEINVADADELISKLNDVDTLMQQFDFIQEQERRMISSVGSSFH